MLGQPWLHFLYNILTPRFIRNVNDIFSFIVDLQGLKPIEICCVGILGQVCLHFLTYLSPNCLVRNVEKYAFWGYQVRFASIFYMILSHPAQLETLKKKSCVRIQVRLASFFCSIYCHRTGLETLKKKLFCVIKKHHRQQVWRV